MAEQTYKTHRRYIPVFHFFAIPVLVLNVVAQFLYFLKWRTFYKAWQVVVAIALAIFIIIVRSMIARVQDRVIRLEETTRLGALLPENLRARVGELTPAQLVALRFASDEEVPGLVERCFTGEFATANQIKKEVKTWRPDNLRM